MSVHAHLSKCVCHRDNLFRLHLLLTQREIVTFSDADYEVARVRRLISKTRGHALRK